MKMMPPDVISHENQLQHLSEPSIFILDFFRTADHTRQIFIPHRHWCRWMIGSRRCCICRNSTGSCHEAVPMQGSLQCLHNLASDLQCIHYSCVTVYD